MTFPNLLQMQKRQSSGYTSDNHCSCKRKQIGAAMSLGRTSTFLDIYIQRDLDRGLITEEQAQEYIDHFIMKLRLVKICTYTRI